METFKQYLFSALMPAARLYWRIFKPKTFGVKVLVLHPQNPLIGLLVRHAYGNRQLWNIPGGGYDPSKESAANAAVREVNEELGINLDDVVLVGEYQTTGEGKRDTVGLYVGTMLPTNTLQMSAEIAEFEWQELHPAQDRQDLARVARRTIDAYLLHYGAADLSRKG